MKISVFGGSSALPSEPAYDEAMLLGSLLGKAGHTILTGGYSGVMEAASRGADEAGAHVIGVTSGEIEAWRNRKTNPWVKEEVHFDTLRDRLYYLVNNCDAAIAMPGGVGTLAEICVFWNQSIISLSPHPKPLFLVGDGWQQVITGLFRQQGTFIREADRQHVQFVKTAGAAAERIQALSPGNSF